MSLKSFHLNTHNQKPAANFFLGTIHSTLNGDSILLQNVGVNIQTNAMSKPVTLWWQWYLTREPEDIILKSKLSTALQNGWKEIVHPTEGNSLNLTHGFHRQQDD
jgi:hypothetical protein